MNLITKIILGLIVFHLLLGFGWLFYKLLPGKEEPTPRDGTLPEEKDAASPPVKPGEKE